MDLESFRIIGVSKTIIDNGWKQIVCDVKEFVARIITEFFANLSEDFHCEGKPAFQQVFVRDHVYEFSPKVICDFLKFPCMTLMIFDKYYDMDIVAIELLGIDSTWPEKKTFKISDLTLKFVGLHKVAMTNWWPTSHYLTISQDFACFLFDVGTWVKVNLGQIMFEFIASRGIEGNKGKNFHFRTQYMVCLLLKKN